MVFLKRAFTFVILFALIIASLASPVAALDPAMTDEQRVADWRRLDNGAKIAACLSRGIGGKGGGVPITTEEKADSKSFSAPDFFLPDTRDWHCRATMPKAIRAFLDADPSTSGTSELDFFTGLGWELAEGKRYAYSRVRGESSQVEFIKKYKLPTIGGNNVVNTTPTSDMTRGKLIAEYQDLCQKVIKYGTRAEIEQSGSAEAKKELREFHDKSSNLYMLATIGDDGAIVETLYRALPNTSTRYVWNPGSTSQYAAPKEETVDLALKCVEAARAFSSNTKASVAALNKEAELKIAKEMDKDLGLCTNLNGAEKNACLASIGKAWTECNKPITTGSTTGATQTRNVDSTATCLQAKFPAVRNKIDRTWVEKIRNASSKLRGIWYSPSGSIDSPASGEDGEDAGPDCALEGGVGWLVCPAMTFIAWISDGAYLLVSGLLEVEPGLLNTDTSQPGLAATYTAWGVFRNIANVAFIIIFLIVIFSQVSNVGISNYGIKRIMPRLIIGAILINASFFISQLAVDLSNIAGGSLKGLLEAAGSSTIGGTPPASWQTIVAMMLGGTLTIAIAGAAAAIAIGLPGLLMFLLTILIVLLILIGRQAGVVLLVAISPLAFASWILPNTEQWFKKWQKMLLGLLLVYPAVALLFGAGDFASKVLSANAANDGLMQIAALIVSALPLIATPSLLKGSMNALGTIGAKFSNLGSSTMSSLNKKRMETSKEKRANLRNDFMNRDFSGQGKSRGIIRRTGRAFARGGQKILRYSDQVKRDRKLKTDLLQSDRDQQYKQGLMADHTAGTLGKRLGSAVDTAAGKGMMEKLRSEAIGNVEATLKASSIDDLKDALQQALKSNDSTTAIAVQNQLLKRGSAGITAFEGAMSGYEKGSSPMSSEIRQDLATNIRESHAGTMDKSLALGQWAIGSESIDDSRTTALNNLAASGMTIEKFSALTEQSQTDLLKSGRAILSQKQLNNLSYPRGALAEKVSPAVSAAAKGAVPKP